MSTKCQAQLPCMDDMLSVYPVAPHPVLSCALTPYSTVSVSILDQFSIWSPLTGQLFDPDDQSADGRERVDRGFFHWHT